MRPPNVVPAFETVTRVAPILRGLLARPTGDDDHPYQPAILSSHTDPEALAFAATCQRLPLFLDTVRTAPLRLESLRGDEPDEELRTRLAKALAGYQAAHQANPEIIALPDVAVFQVSNPAPAPGHDRRLAGRVAVVTGAAGAIGYGICMGLLEHGAHVAITDLPGEKLDQFVAEFQERDAARTTKPARLTALPTKPSNLATASTTRLRPPGLSPSCFVCQSTKKSRKSRKKIVL
ncbi:MAG: SDR family NAD(P)-dependent oxidoreductase [bacterium]